MAKDPSWFQYVGSWPAWRENEACPGTCAYAEVCGRARLCLGARTHDARVVYALARLSALVRERAPRPASFLK